MTILYNFLGFQISTIKIKFMLKNIPLIFNKVNKIFLEFNKFSHSE